jgi:carbonic anhydrase/acetyltransferase-like protein (isoleucine patch superfamily)
MGRWWWTKAPAVWFGATLRGDNEEIRWARQNVQENCVLHTDWAIR